MKKAIRQAIENNRLQKRYMKNGIPLNFPAKKEKTEDLREYRRLTRIIEKGK